MLRPARGSTRRAYGLFLRSAREHDRFLPSPDCIIGAPLVSGTATAHFWHTKYQLSTCACLRLSLAEGRKSQASKIVPAGIPASAAGIFLPLPRFTRSTSIKPPLHNTVK